MIKLVFCLFGLLFTFSVTAQVNALPANTKTDENNAGQIKGSASLISIKKDTNTYTIINITEKNSSKNNETKLNINNEQSGDDVKTTVTKAKQSSKHWFDNLYVNLICAGVNKFVKND